MIEIDRDKPFDIEVAAPAKINLALSVGPAVQSGEKRGYHPIASWFASVSLCDQVMVRRLGADGPSRYAIEWAGDAPRPTPIDWPIEKDLAVRAHRLLEHAAGRSLPIEMVVRKRVPVGGGLGGGSSDAAGALIAIRRLFQLDISFQQLRALSTSLGADVAFFLDEQTDGEGEPPRPALVTGFGEVIERVARTPPTAAILIFPDCSCPTGPVYHAFDRAPVQRLREGEVRTLIERAAATGTIDSAALFNDLAVPACIVEPRLAETLRTLSAVLAPLPVHVTGSGSTMFVLAPCSSDKAGNPTGSVSGTPNEALEGLRGRIKASARGVRTVVAQLG